jgi:voltage-gated potassium channel
VLVLLIVANIACAVLDSVPTIHAAYGDVLDDIERVSLAVFTLEYMLRIWVAPEALADPRGAAWTARLRWVGSMAGLVDLAAILPFIADVAFDMDLRFILLMRLLRFFKIARYSPGFQSLFEAIRSEKNALIACLVILASVILLSAGALYVLEHEVQPDKFGSIPESMWWAIATVTTVGYGDVVPVTLAGRLVGAITMVAGLLMLAMPAGIVATSFANIITRRNFVVTAATVSRMPLFAGVDAATILDLLPAIATITFDAGEYIVRRGERVDRLYLIAEGQVNVQAGKRHRLIGPGDAFGGDTGSSRKSLCAITRARVLVVDMLEAKWLLTKYPHLIDRVTESIQEGSRQSGSGEGAALTNADAASHAEPFRRGSSKRRGRSADT